MFIDEYESMSVSLRIDYISKHCSRNLKDRSAPVLARIIVLLKLSFSFAENSTHQLQHIQFKIMKRYIIFLELCTLCVLRGSLPLFGTAWFTHTCIHGGTGTRVIVWLVKLTFDGIALKTLIFCGYAIAMLGWGMVIKIQAFKAKSIKPMWFITQCC